MMIVTECENGFRRVGTVINFNVCLWT